MSDPAVIAIRHDSSFVSCRAFLIARNHQYTDGHDCLVPAREIKVEVSSDTEDDNCSHGDLSHNLSDDHSSPKRLRITADDGMDAAELAKAARTADDGISLHRILVIC